MSKTFTQAKLCGKRSRTLVLKISDRFWEDLDCPRSLTCYLLAKYGEFDQLVSLRCDPLDYLDSSKYFDACSATDLLRKSNFLDTTFDRDQNALDTFMESESKCKATNERLISLDLWNPNLKHGFPGVITKLARFKIRSILGHLPDSFELNFGFGPGASSTCSGKSVTIADKLQSKISMTPSCYKTFALHAATLPHMIASANNLLIDGYFSFTGQIAFERGNKLTFVPKTSITSRSICIEPHTNIFLQRGYGQYIRDRLKNVANLDLSNQAGKNANLARIGSIDGSYATIDLSSASDTMSYMTILSLLPIEWFEVLDSLRSPETQLPDGSWIKNEKFSSMGNGFTFELETLIFYALSWAVKTALRNEDEIAVFGDDIIVSSEIASQLIEILTFFGFETNKSKTFTTGPFRESCGKDYYLGKLVRSFFIKELPNYETDFYQIANGIKHLSNRMLGGYLLDSRLYRSWSKCIQFIPERLRCFGPEGLGNQVIWSTREYFTLSRANCITWTKILVGVPKLRNLQRFPESTQRAVSLYPGATEKLPCRGSFSAWKWSRVAIIDFDGLEKDWV